MSDNVVTFTAKPEPPAPEPIGDPLARTLAMQDMLLAQMRLLADAIVVSQHLIVQQAGTIDALIARLGLLEQAVIAAGGVAITALARCPEPTAQ